MYEITINTTPEVFNDVPMYFWCIFGVSGENRYNCGHGWSDSIENAAKEANEYYNKNVKPMLR